MAIGNVASAVVQQSVGQGTAASSISGGRFAEAFARATQTAPQGAAGQSALASVAPARPAQVDVVARLAHEQRRMDEVLALAQSGKSFTPAELLSLQTQMYRSSQQLDLAGKVVEKATGGVKQVLQTQL